MPQVEKEFICEECGRHLMRILGKDAYMIPCKSCGGERQAVPPPPLEKEFACTACGRLNPLTDTRERF